MKINNPVLLVGLIFIFGFGSFKLVLAIKDLAEHNSVNWKPITGSVISVESERFTKSSMSRRGSGSLTDYRVSISYSYRAGGEKYFETQEIDGDVLHSEMTEIRSKYEEDADIGVLYNDQNKHLSYLSAYPPRSARNIVGALVIMIFPFGAFFFLRREKRGH